MPTYRIKNDCGAEVYLQVLSWFCGYEFSLGPYDKAKYVDTIDYEKTKTFVDDTRISNGYRAGSREPSPNSPYTKHAKVAGMGSSLPGPQQSTTG